MDKKNGGVTQGDMDAYAELNAELSDPFPSNQIKSGDWKLIQIGLMGVSLMVTLAQ
ncbi:hypothetical protein [Shewanella algae]